MPHVDGMSNIMSNSGGASNFNNSMANASVTNIFSLIKEMVQSQFAALGDKFSNNPHMNIGMIEKSYMQSLDGAKGAIETAFQKTMNTGYTKLFVTCAIIALIGLILTAMLNNNLITMKNRRLEKKEKN